VVHELGTLCIQCTIDTAGRGLHSPTSQLNISRSGQ
jgi:hypothetical protein